MIELLKRYETYPSIVLSGLSPWYGPFKNLGLINSRWQPDIDVAVDAIIVVAILAGQVFEIEKKDRMQMKKLFVIFLGAGTVSGFLSLLFKLKIIYWFGVDVLLLGNILWGLCYVMFFVFLCYAIFTGLACLRRP